VSNWEKDHQCIFTLRSGGFVTVTTSEGQTGVGCKDVHSGRDVDVKTWFFGHGFVLEDVIE
jgi:hypothetical protein